MKGELLVENLLAYAKIHLHLQDEDVDYTRNILLNTLKLTQPYSGSINESQIKGASVPDELAMQLKEYATQNNLVEEWYLDIFVANIFGLLSPLPSQINNQFKQIKEKTGAQKACDYLYDICIKNGYIQKTAIDKNVKWNCQDGNRLLEMTINLSKPEKNNKDTAKLLTKVTNEKYPKCFLCKENEGFEGSLTHPPRRNLRTLKVKLNGENWFMQYSPYAYYDEHCIIINEEHIPMSVDKNTPNKLLDFIDLFPNYFVGSNASLPIVGGSILNHEHYQGGGYLMPMHYAPIDEYYECKSYPQLKVGILDWYNSTINIRGKNRQEVANYSSKIIERWKVFDCEELGILSNTNGTQHNAVTPICRKVGDEYEMNLILRNNCCNEQYPDGIFHAHPEYHNIKKEAIGLIEAMGLFILPGRLKRQFEAIENILCGIAPYDKESLNDQANDLYVHKDMIKELIEQGPCVDKEQASVRVKEYVNKVCANILDNTAVFKKDKAGKEAFKRFIQFIEKE